MRTIFVSGLLLTALLGAVCMPILNWKPAGIDWVAFDNAGPIEERAHREWTDPIVWPNSNVYYKAGAGSTTGDTVSSHSDVGSGYWKPVLIYRKEGDPRGGEVQ